MCAKVENCKRTLKPPILRVQGHSRSSTLTLSKSSLLLLLMICSMSVTICNCFHTKRANSGKIATFWGGSRLWLSLAQASLNLKRRDLDCWNPRLMMKIPYAGCLGLFLTISVQFTLKMCVAGRNREKSTKTLSFGVQGHARSSMLINLKNPPLVLVMMCSMFVLICNRFHTRRANIGKTKFLGDTPLWRPHSRRTPSPKDTKFCHKN